jgi:hypothetical protein
MIPFRWTGENFEPLPRFSRQCDQEFVVGQVYRLEPIEDRSAESHRHFFAIVNEAWQNLPEAWGDRFATPDHLRKWCLIRAGYRDERTFVAKSKTQAAELAAFIRPLDDYAVVAVNGCTVSVFTAKSQSIRAMGRKEFQDSKTKVLDILATMLGVELDALRNQAVNSPDVGKAA